MLINNASMSNFVYQDAFFLLSIFACKYFCSDGVFGVLCGFCVVSKFVKVFVLKLKF